MDLRPGDAVVDVLCRYNGNKKPKEQAVIVIGGLPIRTNKRMDLKISVKILLW